MKVKKIIIVILVFASFTIAFANMYNSDTSLTNTTSSNISDNSVLTDITVPFANTWSSLTNEDDTWGKMYNRSGKWHLGLTFGGMMGGSNMKMRGPTGTIMIMPGYNINKYLGVQYNQMISYGGSFTGIGEATLMIPTGTMIMPYAAAGAGWSNMSGDTQGAWDVGGGIAIPLSKYVNIMVSYRYIETMATPPIAGGGMNQPNARAHMSMVSGGLAWFFGKVD